VVGHHELPPSGVSRFAAAIPDPSTPRQSGVEVGNAGGKAVTVATDSAMVLPGRAAALDDPKYVD
jgi:hypothetical protein